MRGRKNYFEQIRRNLLQEHEEMGLVGDHSGEHYREWQTKNWKSTSEIIGEFKEESDGEMTREEVANLLKHWERTRHLMFWSNHSSIMRHGHVLLTVTAIYDPAFYYTPEKLGGRNVQDLMEKPQIYLLAYSWQRHLEDQLLYRRHPTGHHLDRLFSQRPNHWHLPIVPWRPSSTRS